MIRAHAAYELEYAWPTVEPYIKRALDRGSLWTLEDIWQQLKNSKCQLWTWWDRGVTAVLVTTLYDDTCLLLTFAADNLDSLQCYNFVEEWAASEGCDKMLIHGRLGWARKLGFEVQGQDDLGLYVLEKRLGTIDEQRTKDDQRTDSDNECAGLSTAGA